MFFPNPNSHLRQLVRRRQSSQYKADVQKLADILKPVRRRIVALDIEGTLVSKSLPINFTGAWRENLYKRFVAEEPFWLLRPFAQEMVDILLARENRVVFWTVANMPTVRMILKTSQLRKPENVQLIAKEHNRKVLKTKGLYGRPVKVRTHPTPLKLTEKVKIPSLFGIEALLDDQVDNWHKPFVEVVKPGDVGKLVQVPIYSPGTFGRMKRIYKDSGILVAAPKLAAAF